MVSDDDEDFKDSSRSGRLSPTIKITNPIERQASHESRQQGWFKDLLSRPHKNNQAFNTSRLKSSFGELTPLNTLRSDSKQTPTRNNSSIKSHTTVTSSCPEEDIFQHGRDNGNRLGISKISPLRRISVSSLPELYSTGSPSFEDGFLSTIKNQNTTLIRRIGSLHNKKRRSKEIFTISSGEEEDDDGDGDSDSDGEEEVKLAEEEAKVFGAKSKKAIQDNTSYSKDNTTFKNTPNAGIIELSDDCKNSNNMGHLKDNVAMPGKSRPEGETLVSVDHILHPQSEDDVFVNISKQKRLVTTENVTTRESSLFADLRRNIKVTELQLGNLVEETGSWNQQYELYFSADDNAYLRVLSPDKKLLKQVFLPNSYIREVYYFLDKDIKLGQEHYIDIKFLTNTPPGLKEIFFHDGRGREATASTELELVDTFKLLRLTFLHRGFSPSFLEELIQKTWSPIKAKRLKFAASYQPCYVYDPEVHSQKSIYNTPQSARRYATRSSTRDITSRIASSPNTLPSSPSTLSFGGKQVITKRTPPRPTIPELERYPRVLFTFPPEDQDVVTITSNDVLRIPEGYYLNDSLIDFDLRRMYLEASKTVQEAIHIFSSFFYRKLESEKGNSGSNLARVNIFEKRFSLVPINEHLHWYLAIIFEPLALLQPLNHDEHLLQPQEDMDSSSIVEIATFTTKAVAREPSNVGRTHLFILDSLGSRNRRAAVERLKSFVLREANQRYGVVVEASRITTIYPRLPLQDNLTDCGCFLLEYVEAFLNDPNGAIQLMLRPKADLSNWFNVEQPALRRVLLKELVERLTVKYEDNIGECSTTLLPPSASSDVEEIKVPDD